jgi:bacterioferritin-associated ferredoxin
MADNKPVKACLCTSLPFSTILAIAQERGVTSVSQLTSMLGCGGGCGLCRPYLERMLKTGETEFAVMSRKPAA